MKRILVIDDDEQLRALLCQILECAGFQVQEAPNGATGLRIFHADPADLVITDLIMPEKEGTETIAELHRQYPSVPLVAMSGGGRHGPSDHLSLARNLGARQTVCKPFSREEILQAVRNALS